MLYMTSTMFAKHFAMDAFKKHIACLRGFCDSSGTL